MDPEARPMALLAMSRPRADRYELDPIYVNVPDCQDYRDTGISAISQHIAPNGYEPQLPYPDVHLESASLALVQANHPSYLSDPSSPLSEGEIPMVIASGSSSPLEMTPPQLPMQLHLHMHGAVIAGSPIHYELEALPGGHHLLLFRPTPAQWADFPSIFSLARRLGAAAEGCFKMVLPLEMRHPLPARDPQHFSAIAYKVRQIRARTTWQVSTVRTEAVFASQDGSDADADADADGYPGSSVEAIKTLKTLFMKNRDRRMRNVLYRPDIPAWTPKQRRDAGVPPQSPIHPLGGDRLDSTKAIIPGLHTPYVYESAPHFGASFQLHAEDYRLTSLNHLYKGRKIWVVVPATAVDIAEKALCRKDSCSQFMRHRAEFFFPDRFDKMGIPHRIVDQRPGETIVILPDAYHEGFSTGYTLAEAKNYADSEWTDASYQPCEAQCNLVTAIPREFMRPLSHGEERIDLCADFDTDTDDSDSLTDRSPARCSTISPTPSGLDQDDSASPKKRRFDHSQLTEEESQGVKHQRLD